MLLNQFDFSDFFLLSVGIYMLVTYVWQKLELKYYGEVKPNRLHTLYAVVLAILWALALTSISYLLIFGLLGSIIVRVYILIWMIKIVIEHDRLQDFNKELIEENKELLDNLKTANKNTEEALEIVGRQRKVLQSLGKDLKF